MGSSHDDNIANRNHVQEYCKWRRRSAVVLVAKSRNESTSTTTDCESHTRTFSLLEKLKAPKHSDLTRKRAVDQNFNELIGNPKIF